MKRISIFILVLALAAIACGSEVTPAPASTSASIPENTKTPIPTKAPTSAPLPTSTPVPTNTPDPNLVAPGTYLVGADIQPGIYKGMAEAGLFDSCYWERLKDLTGSLDAILANDNADGQFYIEVKTDDYALKTDCKLYRLDPIPEHVGEYSTTISAGTHLINYDIRPGTYKGQAGTDISGSCYWERLKDVTGDFDSILANDNATGQFYVQVLASDFALKTACELEWVSE